jgi:glutamate N-acetyltransferase / amino-acid N-acetyltransferase
MTVKRVETSTLLPINGIRLSACSAHIYKKNRSDLALIACEKGSNVAAVFTKNSFNAAPVTVSRKHLSRCQPRYLIINSGNANAGLGEMGYKDALKTCCCLAEITKTPIETILPFSTGVIGEPLPVTKICDAIPRLFNLLSDNAWLDVNRAIMTTDTVTKGITKTISINNHEIIITGIAKGSGMIRPNMATMLAFIGTNAAIEKSVLKKLLSGAVDNSFNCISVDGDTSTNDACVLIATGKTDLPVIDSLNSKRAKIFRQALQEVCIYLARAIVSDGEGATKFVSINVDGGKNKHECLLIASAIAHSLLVKTALFASDPNWGRILSAIGNTALNDFNIDRVSVFVGDVCIVRNGKRSPDYTEIEGKRVFSKNEIKIHIKLNRGKSNIQFWTCDLSYEYVRINAEYRT